MSGLRTLASHTAIYGLSSILGRLLNWGLTPLYVNAFAPGEYGVFSDLYAITFPLIIFLTFGLETSFFRFAGIATQPGNPDYGPRRADQAYANGLAGIAGLCLGVGLLVAFNLKTLARVLGYGDQGLLIWLVLGILLLDSLAALPMARLRFDEKPRRFATIALTNIGLTIALNLIFILGMDWGVASVFWANLVASALRLGMALWGNLPVVRPDGATMGRMLRYGAMIMVAGLFGAINETLDRNLLPRLWPSGQAYQGQSYTGLALNGIYAANYKLGMFIALVTQAFRYAAEPLFFKQADQQSAPRLFARALYVYVLGGLAMFVLIASFSFEIVSFNFWGLSRWHLVPPDYWVGLEVVPLILLANLFLGVYTQLSIWFKLTDQLSYGLLISAFGALITLTVNLLLIPTYGYMAAALATLLCYVSMVVLCYFVGQVFYPVPYRWGRLLTYAGLACGLVWLHLALPDWGLGWLKWLTAPSALALMAWAEGLRPHHLRRLRR